MCNHLEGFNYGDQGQVRLIHAHDMEKADEVFNFCPNCGENLGIAEGTEQQVQANSEEPRSLT